eukprot:jgi/Botrbrau1/6812/Bobra.0153s0011.2
MKAAEKIVANFIKSNWGNHEVAPDIPMPTGICLAFQFPETSKLVCYMNLAQGTSQKSFLMGMACSAAGEAILHGCFHRSSGNWQEEPWKDGAAVCLSRSGTVVAVPLVRQTSENPHQPSAALVVGWDQVLAPEETQRRWCAAFLPLADVLAGAETSCRAILREEWELFGFPVSPEDRLRDLLSDGEDSGPGGPLDPPFTGAASIACPSAEQPSASSPEDSDGGEASCTALSSSTALSSTSGEGEDEDDEELKPLLQRGSSSVPSTLAFASVDSDILPAGFGMSTDHSMSMDVLTQLLAMGLAVSVLLVSDPSSPVGGWFVDNKSWVYANAAVQVVLTSTFALFVGNASSYSLYRDALLLVRNAALLIFRGWMVLPCSLAASPDSQDCTRLLALHFLLGCPALHVFEQIGVKARSTAMLTLQVLVGLLFCVPIPYLCRLYTGPVTSMHCMCFLWWAHVGLMCGIPAARILSKRYLLWVNAVPANTQASVSHMEPQT